MTFANIWSELILANVHRLPFHAPLCSEHTLSTLRAQENNQGLLRAPEREGVLERAQERAQERAIKEASRYVGKQAGKEAGKEANRQGSMQARNQASKEAFSWSHAL